MDRRSVIGFGVLVLIGAVILTGLALWSKPAPIPQTADQSSDARTERPTAVWIGDAYVFGPGVDTDKTYSSLVARRLDWELALDALGSTGFLAAGTGPSLPDRLKETVADVPEADIVIVDAGRDDRYGMDHGDVQKEAVEYLLRAQEEWPKAVVVVILPWSAAENFKGAGHPLADNIRAAAVEAGIDRIVDPQNLGLSAKAIDGRLIADRPYPNAKAHKLIAARLVEAFRSWGL